MGQNLITNGDFESFTSLPLNYGDYCNVTGWINPSGCCILDPNFGTPDYVNATAAWPVGIPNNGFGTVSPRSGNGIVGFTTYANYGTPPVFREYITKNLNSPFVIGQSYSISFFLIRASNPYFKYATNNIGVYFSVIPPVQVGAAVISAVPQWEYTSVFSNSSWTLMTFNYIATDTFKYITIGNFRSDVLTTKSTINGSASGLYSHYFIDDLSVFSSSPLPVELLSFDVQKAMHAVRISWATASQKNNDFFSVERSSDLKLFTEIERIPGIQNSNAVVNYETLDKNPLHGLSFYRLKQTDVNGNFSYSEIKSITPEDEIYEESIWFDGISRKIILSNWFSGINEFNFTLYDITGKQIKIQKQVVNGRIEIDASHFSKGLYTAYLRYEINLTVKKLVLF